VLCVTAVAAANTPASDVFSVPAITAATTMSQALSGSVLSGANRPAGSTASVTGVSIAGSTQVLAPGSAITLTDPASGQPAGTLTVSANGTYAFVPVAGYVGAAAAINVYVRSSDPGARTVVASLTIDTLTRGYGPGAGSRGPARGMAWHGAAHALLARHVSRRRAALGRTCTPACTACVP